MKKLLILAVVFLTCNQSRPTETQQPEKPERFKLVSESYRPQWPAFIYVFCDIQTGKEFYFTSRGGITLTGAHCK